MSRVSRIGFEGFIRFEIANQSEIPNITRCAGLALVGANRPIKRAGDPIGQFIEDFENPIRVCAFSNFPKKYMTDHSPSM